MERDPTATFGGARGPRKGAQAPRGWTQVQSRHRRHRCPGLPPTLSSALSPDAHLPRTPSLSLLPCVCNPGGQGCPQWGSSCASSGVRPGRRSLEEGPSPKTEGPGGEPWSTDKHQRVSSENSSKPPRFAWWRPQPAWNEHSVGSTECSYIEPSWVRLFKLQAEVVPSGPVHPGGHRLHPTPSRSVRVS